MPLVAGIKQAFGLKSVLNVTAFVGTFAVLASANLPLLEAVAVASTRLQTVAAAPTRADPPEQAISIPFSAPYLDPVKVSSISLPQVPEPFDTELILQDPTVTTISAAQPALPQPKATRPSGLFGSLEFLTNATKGTGAWRQALDRLDNEQPLYEFCDVGILKCPPKYVAWRRLLAAIRDLPAREQLARLNRGINGLISHGNDADIFRVRDHWAAPIEFLQSGGDCEDYTILKYASLLELGYSDHELRIAVVKDTRRQLDHAVLAVMGTNGVTILDSLIDQPVPHEKLRHYRPVYSVNRTERWVHIATKQTAQLSATRP